jgi:hypothetical protein
LKWTVSAAVFFVGVGALPLHPPRRTDVCVLTGKAFSVLFVRYLFSLRQNPKGKVVAAMTLNIFDGRYERKRLNPKRA